MSVTIGCDAIALFAIVLAALSHSSGAGMRVSLTSTGRRHNQSRRRRTALCSVQPDALWRSWSFDPLVISAAASRALALRARLAAALDTGGLRAAALRILELCHSHWARRAVRRAGLAARSSRRNAALGAHGPTRSAGRRRAAAAPLRQTGRGLRLGAARHCAGENFSALTSWRSLTRLGETPLAAAAGGASCTELALWALACAGGVQR